LFHLKVDTANPFTTKLAQNFRNLTESFMANTKSAEKRARQTERRTARNRAAKTRIKNARKAVSESVKAKDVKASTAKASSLASIADKAANRGVIHKNKASRLKSRAAKTVAAAS
jgi:small subunit ribosomal protein S20